MSTLNNRVEKLEADDKGPQRFIVAWQQLDDENLFELNNTGELVTKSELDQLERNGEDLLKVIYTKDWRGQHKEVNNVKS